MSILPILPSAPTDTNTGFPKTSDTEFYKDPGVRLNNVLATLKYSTSSKSFKLKTGEFSLSDRLPDKAHVGYKLDCLSGMIYVRDKCEAYPNSPKSKFNSLHTSAQTVFYAWLSSPAFSTPRLANGRSTIYPDMTTLKPYTHHSNSVMTTMNWYNITANIHLLTNGCC
ncbi:MAG: hypothetical protein J3R72DRAFT_421702 [Linnemannia gamsii]|nr:MAG: hypothetical protein J3R72DRAFT_421702 [Linnemannia gamsii]